MEVPTHSEPSGDSSEGIVKSPFQA
jgi:hypothetical protein